ncbi:tetraacyldisaccharide 4'-kinase [Methylobacterium sp. Leaf108]|uniref:tetraacyldisaccharide 4'-kinase n=1 Tax=Methylobacterium sp. Leaf108 TaxID=1736256 RepID=UPI0006FF0037|nr:tetraacyldisaccharide 4'-kinase [Methylobacterium sp. Leaf108]KQP60611.1 tetraacyldisaccharide 4'-kinase [Methylobacterium sp. Leaf108]
MRPPAFWDASSRHPAARLLAPLGRLYGRFTAARMDRPGEPGPCPVVCIGNLTLGGAGKTPTALAVAALLRDRGARPAFLTRGYGGRLAGPVAVDAARHDAAAVGDEALLLAWAATTVVSRDRPAGARLCRDRGATAVVMDDGLQNPSLTKTLSLAVVDAGAGIGNGLPFPAGPLRVPLARQWPHVDAVVLVGTGEPGERVAAMASARGLPVFRARLVPDRSGPPLAGRRLLAFAGIGRPDKFFATLREAGAEVVGTRGFPDHHPYRAGDLAALAAEAQRLGAGLITTQKDLVRVPPAFADRIEALPVTLRFADEAAVAGLLRRLPSL